jgi:hypothetical protein
VPQLSLRPVYMQSIDISAAWGVESGRWSIEYRCFNYCISYDGGCGYNASQRVQRGQGSCGSGQGKFGGLLGSLFLRDPTSLVGLYGGSFVGMCLPSRLMHGKARRGQQSAASVLSSFARAGAIAGLIHAITIHYGYWNGGWGGKVGVGLCAFTGCWVYGGLVDVVRLVRKCTQQGFF